jgi:hypothetical protein
MLSRLLHHYIDVKAADGYVRHPSLCLVYQHQRALSSDGFLIIAHCVQKKSSRPEMLAHEVAFAFPVDLRQMDCALALDEPDNLRPYLDGIEIIMCT